MSKQISYHTQVEELAGDAHDLSQYRGKVLLVVNTASKCGYTPQFRGLEKLHQVYGEQGLQVLGFPSDQFNQEHAHHSDIAEVCQINYGVTFPMHTTVQVNGAGTHPLFADLKEGARGLLGSQAVKWNFTKFLVERDGTVLKRYGPKTKPREMRSDIEQLLAKA
jgi:glutathione peroxidase